MADEIVFDKSDSNKNAENAGDLLVKKCVNEKMNQLWVVCLAMHCCPQVRIKQALDVKIQFTLCGDANCFNNSFVLRELLVGIVPTVMSKVDTQNVTVFCHAIESFVATQSTISSNLCWIKFIAMSKDI